MHPLFVSDLQKDRQEELVAAAESWRLTHPCGRTRLRRRAGARLVRLGSRLMGDGSEGT
jgi:hypothetical protein